MGLLFFFLLSRFSRSFIMVSFFEFLLCLLVLLSLASDAYLFSFLCTHYCIIFLLLLLELLGTISIEFSLVQHLASEVSEVHQ